MDFFELLANHHLDSQSRWSKVKDKVETDPRYKAVDSSSQREDLFKQYIEKIAKVSREHWSVAVGVLWAGWSVLRRIPYQSYSRSTLEWQLGTYSVPGGMFVGPVCMHTHGTWEKLCLKDSYDITGGKNGCKTAAATNTTLITSS